MKVFIIRHGQTTNNVLMAEIYARRDRGEITAAAAEEEWLTNRVDDPSITETVPPASALCLPLCPCQPRSVSNACHRHCQR